MQLAEDLPKQLFSTVLNVPVWVDKKTGGIYTKKPAKRQKLRLEHFKAGEVIPHESKSITDCFVDLGIIYG